MDGGHEKMKNRARFFGYLVLCIEIIALLGIFGFIFFIR